MALAGRVWPSRCWPAREMWRTGSNGAEAAVHVAGVVEDDDAAGGGGVDVGEEFFPVGGAEVDERGLRIDGEDVEVAELRRGDFVADDGREVSGGRRRFAAASL